MFSPTFPEDTRLMTVVRLERLALAGRYAAYAIFMSLYLLGQIEGSSRAALLITIVLALHHAFTHSVFWRRRYDLFCTPVNFCVHLATATFAVYCTGAEESEMFVLYFFLLIGYGAYSRRYKMILYASVACCFVYGLVILIESFQHGINLLWPTILSRALSILACGWLVAATSELLRHIEDSAHARAQALASSEDTLRAILDNTADPIFVYDENELITEVNNKACEFLGMSRSRILGLRFRTFLFDEGGLADRLLQLHARGEHHGEEIFIDTDGRERTVEFHARSFTHGPGRLFVVVAHDVTEQKNLQEATLTANRNLEYLNRELRQVNELKTALLQTVSQKMRSPLTAALGYVEMLINEDLGEIAPDQRHALQTCRRSILRVFHLVDESFEAQPVVNDRRT